MNYGEVLTRAWQIVWKYKVLWLFGIFAGCTSRRGPSFNGGSGYQGGGGDFPPELVQRMERFLSVLEKPGIIIALVVLVLLLWAVSIFLGTVGRIGLIRGTVQAEAGVEQLGFGELFSGSMQYFWKLFGMSVVVGLPFLIIFAVLFAGIIFAAIAADSGGTASEAALMALIPVICVLFLAILIVSLVVGVIVQQAQNALVIEALGIFPALKRGWFVVKDNLGPILLMTLLLFIIGAVAGVLLALPVMLVVFPAMVTFILGGSNASMTPLIFAGLCLVAYAPVSIIANGVLIAYIQSAWTLTYLRLTAQEPELKDEPVEYA
ncbi:MAG: hypothetical protein GXP40_11335 [Chloroflexi bacterium]|nr:hypothetical protein [Chloroflexota bacterium]